MNLLSSRRAAGCVLLLAFLAVYGPSAGQGFIKDDFTWVRRARQIVAGGDWTPLVRRGDFFRPVVTASFAANYLVCGTESRCYGWTNVGLALGAAALLGALAVGLGLPAGAALAAAAMWAFNWHGINMAILWVSGRTALLLIVFSLTAALAALRRRWGLTALCTLAALGSKEEAVVLPAMLGALLWFARDRVPWPGGVRLAVMFGGPLAAYFAARAAAGSLSPTNAPPYYQFTFQPGEVLRNVLEYADRSATIVALLVLLAWLLVRRHVPFEAQERAAVKVGAVWLVGGFALTVWLPVRSSLYACFPSVGSALVGAAVLSAIWRHLPAHTASRAQVAALALVVPLLPVLSQRNARLVGQAQLSAQALGAFSAASRSLPDQSLLWVSDDRALRVNLDGAFGSALDDAVALEVGRGIRVWVDPPLTDYALSGLQPPAQEPAARLRLRQGRVESLPPSE